MAAKEVMVTAPLVVLLYDRTFVAGTFAAALRTRRGYYAALASTWLLLAWLVLGAGGARGTAAGFGLGVSPWSYLLKQAEALALYLRLSLWPHPLVLDYGTAVATSLTEVFLPGLLVVVLLALTGWALVRRPRAGFFAAAFFLLLAPSSSFVPLVTQTIAEHRMYLPLAALLALAVPFAAGRLGAWAPATFAALALALAATTIARNATYRDAFTLWSANVAAYPSAARGHVNLALELQRAGDFSSAEDHFARAIALQPGYVAAHFNRAVALLDQARPADALAQLDLAARHAPPGQTALRLDHAYAEAHVQLARLAERAGEMADAEKQLLLALRHAPADAAAHARLGLLLARTERPAAAEPHLRAALAADPVDADSFANLGNTLLLLNRPREAIACYEQLLRLRPADRRAQENLQLARDALRP
jgi:tetratricopeptide (TPR) repeat protein